MADAFAQLLASASERNLRSLPYSGDVLASEAFEFCKNNNSQNNALIIDVRTKQEWQKTGVPDLANTVSELLTISWLTFPNFAINQNFASELAIGIQKATYSEVVTPCLTRGLGLQVQSENLAQDPRAEAGMTRSDVLFFLCKSGGRSLDAAIFAKSLGYEYTFNIAGGFEGGEVAGWKEQSLPYKQYVAEEYEVSHA